MTRLLHILRARSGISPPLALALPLAALLVTTAVPAHAQYIQWQSGLGAVTDESALTLAAGVPPSALRVTSSAIAISWIYKPLTLPSDARIDSITVCYEASNPGPFITQTRLMSMSTPDTSVVIIDDETDLLDDLGCYTIYAGDLPIGESYTLALALRYGSGGGYIEIGAIGVHLSPATSAVGEAPSADAAASKLLRSNRPNPFNPETRIDFTVPQQSAVTLMIYDVEGRHVRALVDEPKAAGRYTARWDGRGDAGETLASGTYFYRLELDGRAETRKMIMLK